MKITARVQGLFAIGAVLLPISIALAAPSKKIHKKQQEVFAAIEDEELVLIPENEVEAPQPRSAVETSVVKAPVAAAKPKAAPVVAAAVAIPSPTPPPVSAPTPVAPAAAAVTGTSTQVTVSFAKAAPDAASEKPVDYYRVNAKDINTLTYRLRIVQAILEESGKAYDYRSLKTKELVKILNRLRAEKRASDSLTSLEEAPLAE